MKRNQKRCTLGELVTCEDNTCYDCRGYLQKLDAQDLIFGRLVRRLVALEGQPNTARLQAKVNQLVLEALSDATDRGVRDEVETMVRKCILPLIDGAK